jgi:hypothetical protein
MTNLVTKVIAALAVTALAIGLLCLVVSGYTHLGASGMIAYVLARGIATLGRALVPISVTSWVTGRSVVGDDILARRLALRVTLVELAALGVTATDVLQQLAQSLRLSLPGELVTAADLVDRFEPSLLPHTPWVIS